MEAADLHVFFAGRTVKGSLEPHAALGSVRPARVQSMGTFHSSPVKGAGGICLANNWLEGSAE